MRKLKLFITLIGIMSIIISCSNEPKKVEIEVEKEIVVNQFEFEKQATLSGMVQLIPNASETEMKSYVLVLEKPINIASKSSEYKNQDEVQEILISFSDEKINPDKYLDKKITISGTLTATQTIHDKRPVGIFDAVIK